MCARITPDEPRNESLVDIACGAARPMEIPIEHGDQLHVNEHDLQRVTPRFVHVST